VNLVRWIVCFPLGLAGAAVFSGIIIRLGDAVVGSWAPASGLVVYAAAGNLPVIAMVLGLGVAPRASRRLKWLLLSPHLAYGAFFALPTLAVLVFSSESLLPRDVDGLSRSLTPGWQAGLWSLGYLAGIVFAATREIEKLAPAEEQHRPQRPFRLTKVPEILWKETRYSKLAAKAYSLREKGRIREAIASLHRARETIEQLQTLDPGSYAHPLGQAYRRLADAHAEIGERGKAREHFEASVPLLREADRAKPGLCTVELAETLVDLAKASLEDARELFLALDEKRPGERTGDVARTESHLGILHCENGEVELGRVELERALERFRGLNQLRPGAFTEDIVLALLSLGSTYGELGRYEQAQAYLEEALRTLGNLDDRAEFVGPARARVSLCMATVQTQAGRLHEARATYHEGLRQLEAFEARRPGAFTVDLTKARENLSNLLRNLGFFHEARIVLEKNQALLRELDRQESGAYTRELALTQVNLGAAYAELGEYGKARHSLEEGLARLRLLEEAQPGALSAELATALTNSALVATNSGRFESAETLLNEALALLLPLYEKQPDLHAPNLAMVYSNLATLFMETRRLQEARDRCDDARRLLEEHEGETSRFFHQLAVIYGNLGTAYSELGELNRRRGPEQLQVEPVIPCVDRSGHERARAAQHALRLAVLGITVRAGVKGGPERLRRFDHQDPGRRHAAGHHVAVDRIDVLRPQGVPPQLHQARLAERLRGERRQTLRSAARRGIAGQRDHLVHPSGLRREGRLELEIGERAGRVLGRNREEKGAGLRDPQQQPRRALPQHDVPAAIPPDAGTAPAQEAEVGRRPGARRGRDVEQEDPGGRDP
jgi:tetratricopeptide (TPR) repeat protein